MKPVRIIRHEDWIKGGHLIDSLKVRGIPFEEVALDEGMPLPQRTDDISALVFLGCSSSLTEMRPWMVEELDLIRKAMDADLPILGHCFGSQLLAVALGGDIAPMPQKEIGWHRVGIADTDAARTWCGEIEDPEILIWHHDAFTLPEGADPLYSSSYCADQAFAYGDKVVATVAHVELTAPLFRSWVESHGDDIAPQSDTVMSIEEILRDVDGRIERMHRLTDRLYDRWFATFA